MATVAITHVKNQMQIFLKFENANKPTVPFTAVIQITASPREESEECSRVSVVVSFAAFLNTNRATPVHTSTQKTDGIPIPTA